MAKKINFNINFGNKTFYTILAIVIFLIVGGVVIAYNTIPANPSEMGHTCDEIEGGCGGGSGGSLSCSDYPIVPMGALANTVGDNFCSAKGEVCVGVDIDSQASYGAPCSKNITSSYTYTIRCCKII